mgnify:FL=1
MNGPFNSYTTVHFAIMTTWNEFNTRLIIRRSWLTFPGNYSYSFIIGKAKDDKHKEGAQLLQTEMTTYGDLVTGDFIDSYYNLTRKAVVMLSLNNQADYLFKADTDTYVNVPHLLRYLNRKRSLPVQYAGRLVKSLLPDRDKAARWHVPSSAWPDDTKVFPPFAQGQGYLLKSSLAQCMLQTIHQDWPDSRLDFPLEDVFIGILAESCRVYPKHLVSFAQYMKQKKDRLVVPGPAQGQVKGGLVVGMGSEVAAPIPQHNYQLKEWIYAHRKTGSEILVHLLEY